MDDFLRRAGALMARQQALITAAQAQALGASRQRLGNLVRRGVWERIDHGVYGPSGVPLTWRRRLMAAVLAAGTGALASHRSAASLHGVGGLDDPPLEISVPRGRRIERPGLVVHESTDLDLAGRCIVDGIPCTGRVRLAVDLGAVVSPDRLKHTIRELRHRCGLSADELLRAYLAHSRRGRNGTGRLRDWLDRYYDVVGTPESGLEVVVLDAILDAGLPAPVSQHWVSIGGHRYRLDFAYPGVLVAVEVDGTQHEEDPDVIERDVRRLAILEDAGWTVLVIRRSHFASDLAAAITALRKALCAPASRHV